MSSYVKQRQQYHEHLDRVTGQVHPAVVVKSVAERKQEERERRKALGLKRYELWLRPKDWPRVRKYIERLVSRIQPKDWS